MATGAVVLLFCLTKTAGAQDSTRSWSLGVDNQSGVYIGIPFSPGFRLEPEIGLIRQRDRATIVIDNGFGTPTVITDQESSASYRIGVGFLAQWQRVPHVRLYAGPRFGVILERAEQEVSGSQLGKSSAKRTDWFLAGSLGAEYFPVERLSAGADVQLRGIAQGTPTESTTGNAGTGVFAPSEPTLSTRGLLTVRFYM